MQPLAEKLRKDGGPGVLLSLLLHGLLLLAALWYVQSRPSLMETRLKALPVELVVGGILEQARMHTDQAFRDMALSARDAALLASPIQIPGMRLERNQTLTIVLDPKAVLH